MGLTICNGYHRPLSATIMFYSPNRCAGTNFEMRGWWNANPGECRFVYSGSLRNLNRYWYFYAFATDGATWSGPGFWRAVVPRTAFDLCYGTNVPNGVQVNFRELDINGFDNFTLTLTA
jgi:uncharacterized membrane protein